MLFLSYSAPMKHSHNIIHKIRERAIKTGKAGKYILTILPFLYQNLNMQEAKSMTNQSFPQAIEKTKPDRHPDKIMDESPASIKDIPLDTAYLKTNTDFFISMTELLNKNIDDIEKINTLWKELNKDIRTANPIMVDGVKVGRFAVTSFFAMENDEVVLKNASEIVDKQKIYTVDAVVKNSVYNDEQVLLFETNDKEYDYDIVLHKNGDVSIVSKGGKTKPLKLENDSDSLKFDTFLKEIFPPAYISYRDKIQEELKEQGKF